MTMTKYAYDKVKVAFDGVNESYSFRLQTCYHYRRLFIDKDINAPDDKTPFNVGVAAETMGYDYAFIHDNLIPTSMFDEFTHQVPVSTHFNTFLVNSAKGLSISVSNFIRYHMLTTKPEYPRYTFGRKCKMVYISMPASITTYALTNYMKEHDIYIVDGYYVKSI